MTRRRSPGPPRRVPALLIALVLAGAALAAVLRGSPPAHPPPTPTPSPAGLNAELRRLPPLPAAGPSALVLQYVALGYPMTSPYGPRSYSLSGEMVSGFHTGVDFAMPRGTQVPAPADGVVSGVAYDDRRGWQLLVYFPAYGLYANYCHSDFPPPWRTGQRFRAGQPLYTTGDSGRSTGPHLHLEFMDRSFDFVDPTLP